MDPTYPLAPIANFFSAVLVLLPLFTNALLSGPLNVAVVAFAIWTSVECVTTGINSILWSDNVKNIASVWCDITTHLDAASNVAIRGCTFSIVRHLYHATYHDKSEYHGDRTTNVLFDLTMTLGLPAVLSGLYPIVQSNRFAIIEGEGCVQSVDNIGLSILLYDLPIVLIPCITIILYCPRILLVLRKHKLQDDGHPANRRILSREIYFRMLVLGFGELVLTLPLSIFMFCLDLTDPSPGSFWPGWANVHRNFGKIPVTMASEWQTDVWQVLTIKWDLWISAFTAVIFFVFFSTTQESRNAYRGILRKMKKIHGSRNFVRQEYQGGSRNLGRNTAQSIPDFNHSIAMAQDDTSDLETGLEEANDAGLV